MKSIPRLLVLLLAAAMCALSQDSATQDSTGPPVDEVSPNLPTQRLGPNDLIRVRVYDSPELSHTLRIDSQGFIRMSMVRRPIKAAGLMPSELEAAIGAVLANEQILVNPIVTVTIAEYRSHPVSVTGAVRHPVTFQALGDVTLLDALNRADGLTPTAGPEILVSLPGDAITDSSHSLVRRIPVKDLMNQSDLKLNIKLRGGEEIRVPEAGKVYVVGDVKKPGVFPVEDSEGMTVLKLLAYSEGLMPYASNHAYLYRSNDGAARKEIPIEIKKIVDRKISDVPLQVNDVLYIPDSNGKRYTIGALEKLFLVGTISSSALMYSVTR